jgi:hypothetical protein
MKSLKGLVCAKYVRSMYGFAVLCGLPPEHEGPCRAMKKEAPR